MRVLLTRKVDGKVRQAVLGNTEFGEPVKPYLLNPEGKAEYIIEIDWLDGRKGTIPVASLLATNTVESIEGLEFHEGSWVTPNDHMLAHRQ